MQNRRYTVVQSRGHFVCEGILHDMKRTFTKFLFFFISSGFDASINFIGENMQKYMKFFD